jgi:4-amino-4-deoxy-L-arabinose transferase-like glycosyltransferase
VWDENVYLGNARSHIAKSNFTEDFRFPLLEWLIALVWLPGESLLVAKIFIILMTLATVFFTYLISREYFSAKKAFLVTLGFGLSTLIVFWGFRIYADIPALFFTVVSFYCLLKKESADGKKAFILTALAGIMASLSFLARFSFALFAFSFGIYCIFRKRYKDLAVFAVFFILALTPWLAYNQMHYQNPVWDLKEQYSGVEKWTDFEPPAKHLRNLFISMGIFSILLPFGIYSLFRKRNEKKLIWLVLIYTVISLAYYFFLVKMKDMRYYIPFLPFLYLIAFDAVFWLESKMNKKIMKKIIVLFVMLNIVVVFGATLFYLAKSSDYERNGSLYHSILYLKEKSAYESTILSNAWPWFGYHLNAKVASLWTDDLGVLIETYDPDYIVYDSAMGISFNETILSNDSRLDLEKEINDKYNHKVSIYSLTKKL